ncbi:riboflavin biosynthesis protein RibF [Salmonella enterica subsp. enterica serovar Heidelberg]|nr:riboflavin biosynthesis protein RibF [Salmonella enterica subsp. enterica serovar Heidelberg]
MKLIRGIHNLSQAPHGCVLTIGNFDGVHRGHRALLQGLQEEGRRRGLPVVVMIFEPQPLELFATDKAPARLTRLREKLYYLAQCGVDYVLCVKIRSPLCRFDGANVYQRTAGGATWRAISCRRR